ncbi:hypothetical protein VTI74DRAFT_7855 [Chaetomium olivicolor]
MPFFLPVLRDDGRVRSVSQAQTCAVVGSGVTVTMGFPQHLVSPAGHPAASGYIAGSMRDNYQARNQHWTNILPGGMSTLSRISPDPEYARAPEPQPPAPGSVAYTSQAGAAKKTFSSLQRKYSYKFLATTVGYQSPYSQPIPTDKPNPLASFPQPNIPSNDRPHCEVKVLRIRQARGAFKYFWSVEIDGNSQEYYTPPDYGELARHYNLTVDPSCPHYIEWVSRLGYYHNR